MLHLPVLIFMKFSINIMTLVSVFVYCHKKCYHDGVCELVLFRTVGLRVRKFM
jgi:hypothetical protein